MATTSRSNPKSRITTVVLDRDGTLVVDRNYLDDPDQLEFLPLAREGLCRLHQRGYRLVVISNQSGVGRGLFSLERLDQINVRLQQMARTAGAELSRIYCCPHRPEEGCACRKPGTALLLQAARELDFDPKAAVVIGDKASDVELGRRVGALTLLISTDPGVRTEPPADHVVTDLLAAANLLDLLHGEGSASPRSHHAA